VLVLRGVEQHKAGVGLFTVYMAMSARCSGSSAFRPSSSAPISRPPFPDYVSGHSTFSAAAAQVLRSFTGSDTLGLAGQAMLMPIQAAWWNDQGLHGLAWMSWLSRCR
jgi:hypothetical protein